MDHPLRAVVGRHWGTCPLYISWNFKAMISATVTHDALVWGHSLKPTVDLLILVAGMNYRSIPQKGLGEMGRFGTGPKIDLDT